MRFNEDFLFEFCLGKCIVIVHLFIVTLIQEDQIESKEDGRIADDWCIFFKTIFSFFCRLNHNIVR